MTVSELRPGEWGTFGTSYVFRTPTHFTMILGTQMKKFQEPPMDFPLDEFKGSYGNNEFFIQHNEEVLLATRQKLEVVVRYFINKDIDNISITRI